MKKCWLHFGTMKGKFHLNDMINSHLMDVRNGNGKNETSLTVIEPGREGGQQKSKNGTNGLVCVTGSILTGFQSDE